MTFAHESIAALPQNSPKDGDLLRALLTRRLAYALAANEDAQDFVAADPATGVLPLYLIQNNVVFQYDSTDTTTAHDGTTCLVTSDSKRYKSDANTYPWSVLSRATAQPTSPPPSVGDRYLLTAAATGTDWSGHDDEVAIYTARGWVFATVPVGRFLYVQDETAFYHRNTSGDWTIGVGSVALSTNSVPLSAILGSGIRSIVKVEDQTTNTPPSSPVAPVAYIIGSSPTGAWAGKAAQVAICEADGTWTYYVPTTGDRVYDKSIAIDVTWNGSAWVSIGGTWIEVKSSFTQGAGSTTQTGAGGFSSGYTYSSSSGPDASRRMLTDDATITHAAKAAGTRNLRFRYSADVSAASLNGTVTGDMVIALYRDSTQAPIDWCYPNVIQASVTGGTPFHLNIEFMVSAPDALSHTYKIGLLSRQGSTTGSNWQNWSAPTRRLFTLEEKA